MQNVLLCTTRLRARNPLLVRALLILTFAALTAITARISIYLPFTPVPLTLQVLAVLLSGLVLGATDGALSQVVYVAAITLGAPLDAGGLGTAVWLAPTAGYLLGFIPAAFVTGYLANPARVPNRLRRFLGSLAGVAVIYLAGTAWLTLGYLHGDWAIGIALGVLPFIGIDLLKAIMAGLLAESGATLIQSLSK